MISSTFLHVGYNWQETDTEEDVLSSSFKFAWKFFKIFCVVIILLAFIGFGSYTAINHNAYLARKMRNMMHDRNIAYIFARYMRKISLPLHSIVDLKQAQKWECLVQNPFYKSGWYYLFCFRFLEYLYLISKVNYSHWQFTMHCTYSIGRKKH